jgi:hypothetical protein
MDTLQSTARFLLGVATVAGCMRLASAQKRRGLFVRTAQAKGLVLQSIKLDLRAAYRINCCIKHYLIQKLGSYN